MRKIRKKLAISVLLGFDSKVLNLKVFEEDSLFELLFLKKSNLLTNKRKIKPSWWLLGLTMHTSNCAVPV